MLTIEIKFAHRFPISMQKAHNRKRSGKFKGGLITSILKILEY